MKYWTGLIGRFGNQLFQYAKSRAMAERDGATLCTPPWIGEKIFQIPEACREQEGATIIGGYGQDQESLIYSRKQVREWFRFRPEIEERLIPYRSPVRVICHFRRGDFGPLGYVLPSRASYLEFLIKNGLGENVRFSFVSEESAQIDPYFQRHDMGFLPDFYTMMTAPTLLRANSSFSWWAATLGEGRVFSPVIEGLEGGKEHDVNFSEGNWPRLANLPNITDLHMFNVSDRYDYPWLTSEDTVLDVGCYQGDWTGEIYRKFGCSVIAFEPCAEFFLKCQGRFGQNQKIELHHAALGAEARQIEIGVKGDMTGEFEAGNSRETVWMHDIAEFLEHIAVPKVVKLNCEGGEFAIMERLIEKDLVKGIRSFQIQFHTCAPDAAKRRAAIVEHLNKTHRPTFSEPLVWEGWELR